MALRMAALQLEVDRERAEVQRRRLRLQTREAELLALQSQMQRRTAAAQVITASPVLARSPQETSRPEALAAVGGRRRSLQVLDDVASH
jgi:hypothetical protein